MAHHRWRSGRCPQQWRQLATRARVVHLVAADAEPSTALLLRAPTPDPEKLIAQLRSEVAAIDRGVALYAVQTYDDIFAQTLGPRRYEMLLLSSFACLALLWPPSASMASSRIPSASVLKKWACAWRSALLRET